MKAYCSGVKEKMLELTRLFCVERNVFQKFVIIYRYITLIDKDPIIHDILQKIFDDTVKTMGEAGDELNENNFLNVKSEIIHTNEFWVYYSNLKIIHSRMKKLKECKININNHICVKILSLIYLILFLKYHFFFLIQYYLSLLS